MLKKEKFVPNCSVDDKNGIMVCQPYIVNERGEIVDKPKGRIVFRVKDNTVSPIEISVPMDYYEMLKEKIDKGEI